jgi:hypothetical protein
MAFGTRSADAEPREFSTDFLRSFKAGETKVRFCEEVDDWWEFYEHYTAEGKSYPCTGDRKSCQGCNSENEKERKASRKFGTTVKLIDEKRDDDLYLPMRIPVGVEKKMRTRSERNDDTVLNRDYVILREGTGFDTEYDVETDEKYVISKEVLKENCFIIEDILQKMWDEVWVEKPEADDNQTEEITEAQLKKMPVKELRLLANKHLGDDVDISDMTKGEIIDALIEAAEDDGPPF